MICRFQYSNLVSMVILQAAWLCVNTAFLEGFFNNTQVARIVHGETTVEGEFPFVGHLFYNIKFFNNYIVERTQCGGSILSRRIILTAAHCVVSPHQLNETSTTIYTINMPINMEFIAGSHKLLEDQTTERQYRIAGIIVHPEYHTLNLHNDIALLITSEDIVFNENTKTIALPDLADIDQLYAEGAPATVIGWGTTESGLPSSELKQLQYNVVSETKCKEVYGEILIQPGMMCTGKAPMTEKHVGLGDSGGPVFVKKASNEFVQLGVVSWGVEDQGENTWDVNTDVGYYLDWITDNIDTWSSEYVTTTYAEDSAKSINYHNIPNLTLKTVTILPTDTSKYTTITFKSGKIGRNDFIIVYDGSDIGSDKQLAQLTGTISELTVTATTNKGLTVAIMTDSVGVSEGFTFNYKQVVTKGESTDLICPSGFKACSDNYYCLDIHLFCNSQEDRIGECRDGSDEVQANCESNTDPDNDNNNTSENGNSDDDDDDNSSEENFDDDKTTNTENKPCSSRTDQAINSTIWLFLLTIPRIFC